MNKACVDLDNFFTGFRSQLNFYLIKLILNNGFGCDLFLFVWLQVDRFDHFFSALICAQPIGRDILELSVRQVVCEKNSM